MAVNYSRAFQKLSLNQEVAYCIFSCVLTVQCAGEVALSAAHCMCQALVHRESETCVSSSARDGSCHSSGPGRHRSAVAEAAAEKPAHRHYLNKCMTI